MALVLLPPSNLRITDDALMDVSSIPFSPAVVVDDIFSIPFSPVMVVADIFSGDLGLGKVGGGTFFFIGSVISEDFLRRLSLRLTSPF